MYGIGPFVESTQLVGEGHVLFKQFCLYSPCISMKKWLLIKLMFCFQKFHKS